MSRLCYQGEQFLLDQKPFRILSGTSHYFRVTPDYWEDRLKKLRACGGDLHLLEPARAAGGQV